MDDVLKVTGQSAEDFEVTARRYATLPKAQRTLANGVRAWFDFMRTPLSPGYNTARYERDMPPGSEMSSSQLGTRGC